MIIIFPVISGVHSASREFLKEDNKMDGGTENRLISPLNNMSISSVDHTVKITYNIIIYFPDFFCKT